MDSYSQTPYYLIHDLVDAWEEYVAQRNPFTFGSMEIDLDDFKMLVKKTFELIKKAKEEYIFKKEFPEDVEVLFVYLRLLSIISQYIPYDDTEDESENKIFTATCIVAMAISDFACFTDTYRYNEKRKKEFYIDERLASGTLWSRVADIPFYFQESALSKEQAFKIYEYNVYEGDLSQFIELAHYLE